MRGKKLTDIHDPAEPILGEVRRRKHFSVIWAACETCGKERWVQVTHGEPKSHRCHSCVNGERNRNPELIAKRKTHRGDKNYAWKGGKHTDIFGYVHILVQPNHPLYCMANEGGYIREHRLMISNKIGRALETHEHVHHINGIRNDNRIENLMLLSRQDHNIYSHLCAKCELRKEIRSLREQIKKLVKQKGENIK